MHRDIYQRREDVGDDLRMETDTDGNVIVDNE